MLSGALIGESRIFPPINVATWGGLLLTLIIASAVIILSFPIGMVLALGRRSEIRGIPWWLIWPVAIIATIWGLTTSTPEILATAQNTVQRIVAFWPLLIHRRGLPFCSEPSMAMSLPLPVPLSSSSFAVCL